MNREPGLLGALSNAEKFGLAVVYAWVVWVMLATSLKGGDWQESAVYILAPGVAIVGVAWGRRWSAPSNLPTAAAGLVGVAGYVLLSVALRGGAGGGPLGYANANAALAVQLVTLAGILALVEARENRRPWSFAAVAAAGIAVPFTHSRAGVILLLPILTVVVATQTVWARERPARLPLWAGVGALVTLFGAGVITLIAAQRTVAEWFTGAVDTARQELWSDALSLWGSYPFAGAGPGGFIEYSALAKDPDTARAHMSMLQVGAELGAVGVVIFFAMAISAFAILAQARSNGGLIAVVGVTALMLHSFVDHVLEYPAVMLVAGLMVGVGSKQLYVAEGEHPIGRRWRGDRQRPGGEAGALPG